MKTGFVFIQTEVYGGTMLFGYQHSSFRLVSCLNQDFFLSAHNTDRNLKTEKLDSKHKRLQKHSRPSDRCILGLLEHSTWHTDQQRQHCFCQTMISVKMTLGPSRTDCKSHQACLQWNTK